MIPPGPGPLTRRIFLRAGTLALGGLTFSDVLAARARAGTAPDTSVILFWMWGGPSQIETWDPKPDAPAGYRGPFRPIRTAVPGMDFCELFPRQATVAKHLAVVRSLHHAMSSRNDGSIELLTGKSPVVPHPTSTAKSEHPDFPDDRQHGHDVPPPRDRPAARVQGPGRPAGARPEWRGADSGVG